MTTPHDLPRLPEKPIFEEFPEWDIEPVAVGCTDTTTTLGWTATKATNDGRDVHTVGAPTITELRLKLREITSRRPPARPGAYIPAD